MKHKGGDQLLCAAVEGDIGSHVPVKGQVGLTELMLMPMMSFPPSGSN